MDVTDLTDDDVKQTVYELDEGDELRFEVKEDVTVTVTLVEGVAEMFGTELSKHKEGGYEYTACKLAIFTWHGCKLKVRGECTFIDKFSETPMVSYINAHGALDNLRWKSKRETSLGPKALVVGPQDSGKSSLCRILLNYAVRAQWEPTYVDLDVGQNSISIPGCIAATPITRPFEPNTTDVETDRQINYFFGHTSPAKAVELYKKMVTKLADVVEQRCLKNEQARHAGVIINTCGWVEDAGYDLLVQIADLIKVDVILVMENAKLWSRLKADEAVKATVAKLAKSGGVVVKNLQYRRKLRQASIKAYFYGRRVDLCPHPQVFNFDKLRVYRCGDATQAPASALPLGTKRRIDPNRLVLCDPNVEDLTNNILAVCYADDENNLLEENVAGFVHVSAVDLKKREFTLLSPSAQSLPQPFLLTGSLKFFDN